jgi:hypothetical protein
MLSGRTALIAVAGYAHFPPSDRGLAAHVALQFVNWRCLWPAHDVERDGLVRVTAKAPDLKIEVARIERVAEGR